MSALWAKTETYSFRAWQRLFIIGFSDIAERYLHSLGYEPFECDSEREEARGRCDELINRKNGLFYFL